MEIDPKDVAQIIAFDEKFFSVPRPKFLKCWLAQKDSSSFMVKDSIGEICGYGVIRKCFRGYKIGPLFSNSSDVADALFASLLSKVPGEQVFLDVPEVNLSAVSLANRNRMQPVFATVRMYTKYVPLLPLDKIYGVTSFELG